MLFSAVSWYSPLFSTTNFTYTLLEGHKHRMLQHNTIFLTSYEIFTDTIFFDKNS